MPNVEPTERGVAWWAGDRCCFTRREVTVRRRDGGTESYPLAWRRDRLVAALGRWGHYEESLSPVREGWMTGAISLVVATDDPFIVQCPCEWSKPPTPPYFLIPGFLYGTNNLATSTGKQPKFNYGGPVGWPVSSKFFIRSDRSTHPGVIVVGGGRMFMVGIGETMKGGGVPRRTDLWQPAHFYTGLMLDTSEPGVDRIGFQLGYENAPRRHGWSHEQPWSPPQDQYLRGWLEHLSGRTLTVESRYFAGMAKRVADWSQALRAYYRHVHEAPTPRCTRDEAIAEIGAAMVAHGYNRSTRVFDLASNPDGQGQGDIAWTGGMQVAYPLLKAGVRASRAAYVATARDFIEHLCADAMNRSAGLLNEEHRDGRWQVTGWWGVRESCCNFGDKPLHSAYLNGQAAYYLLRAAELDGLPSDWIATARTVVETAMRAQRKDGAFGMFFAPRNGAAVDYDGFQGCWLAAAAAALGRITGERRFLDAARRAVDYYHQWHLRGELYGTPMDTHRAVDEEGNLAFLAAGVELHRSAPDDTLKAMLLDAAAWEFSFKFPYARALSNEPLRSLGWSSCGGSITSTHHNSIHQMGNLAAADLFYLAEITGDSLIASRLRDTCIWGLNTHNRFDGEFGFGFTGQATEQFFYTDGIVCPSISAWDGGLWDVTLPWASACCLLSSSDDIPDTYYL